MRYQKLIIEDKSYTNPSDIDRILKNQKFYWLIDSEIEDAVIEIKKNTIIWHSGNFYSGDWIYGIFESGNFYGNWINGLWEGGNFKGTGNNQ